MRALLIALPCGTRVRSLNGMGVVKKDMIGNADKLAKQMEAMPGMTVQEMCLKARPRMKPPRDHMPWCSSPANRALTADPIETPSSKFSDAFTFISITGNR